MRNAKKPSASYPHQAYLHWTARRSRSLAAEGRVPNPSIGRRDARRALSADVRRFRPRRRVAAATVALLAVSTGAATLLSTDSSDKPRSKPRTVAAPPQTRTPTDPRSPTPSTPLRATASPQAAAIQSRANEFLTGYLALLHGRRFVRALRRVAERGLLRELRRNRPRVTPAQQQTATRTVDLRTALPSPGSARAVATLRDRDGTRYPLLLCLERRGALWVVTRIGDA